MNNVIRFEIVTNDSYSCIAKIETIMDRDDNIVNRRSALYLPEDGMHFSFDNDADNLCSLLNDGLRFRNQYKDNQFTLEENN